MRYGLLADIHGNLPALESALASLRRLGVDRYLVAGDVVGYGPFPNECVAAVADLDAVCDRRKPRPDRAGRTERRAVHPAGTEEPRLDEKRSRRRSSGLPGSPPPPRASRRKDRHRARVSRRPERVHASAPSRRSTQLGRLATESPAVRFLVLGHTHRPWACDEAGTAAGPALDGRLSLGTITLGAQPR